MAVIKKRSRIQSVMTQFGYEHRRLDSQLSKIRKNADELAKMLDSLEGETPPKKNR